MPSHRGWTHADAPVLPMPGGPGGRRGVRFVLVLLEFTLERGRYASSGPRKVRFGGNWAPGAVPAPPRAGSILGEEMRSEALGEDGGSWVRL